LDETHQRALVSRRFTGHGVRTSAIVTTAR
jgi:hypothetical protein